MAGIIFNHLKKLFVILFVILLIFFYCSLMLFLCYVIIEVGGWLIHLIF
jgi:hypothetical protein